MTLSERVARAMGWRVHEDTEKQCLRCGMPVMWINAGEDIEPDLPDFPNDHNACFNIIVPFMVGKGFVFECRINDGVLSTEKEWSTEFYDSLSYADNHESLPTAICLAMLKALGGTYE